jgi:hypothetical protein
LQWSFRTWPNVARPLIRGEWHCQKDIALLAAFLTQTHAYITGKPIGPEIFWKTHRR